VRSLAVMTMIPKTHRNPPSSSVQGSIPKC
jgi:hypothetical protein